MNIQLFSVSELPGGYNSPSEFVFFGVDASNRVVELIVRGFCHNIYIHSPRPISADKKRLLNGRLSTLGAVVGRIREVRRRSLLGYTTKPMICQQLPIYNMRRLCDVCTIVRETLDDCMGLVFYNCEVDPTVSLLTQIGTSGWISLPDGLDERVNSVGERCRVTKHVAVGDLQAQECIDIVKGHVISFDIECVALDGGFPSAAKDPVVQIATVDEAGNKRLFSLHSCDPIDDVHVQSFETEMDMLVAWSNFIKHEDPDILTGYNICGFDLPYLIARMMRLECPDAARFGRTATTCVARDLGNINGRSKFKVNVPGRLVIDMLAFIQSSATHRLSSYTLNSVAEHFLGEKKDDVHYSQIAPLFEGTSATRARLGAYCVKDALLPLRLCNHLQTIQQVIAAARVAGVPPNYIVERGQTVRVAAMIYRQLRGSDFIVPDSRTMDRSADGYKGATVLEPVVGFHNAPIATLDFASLYPSIMIAYNICYTTLASEPSSITETSPNGYHFVRSEHHCGILPKIVMGCLGERKRIRAQIKDAADENTRRNLDALQLELKVAANSVYGYTGTAIDGILTCFALSSSITAYGRSMLEKTRLCVENELGATVLYGDTDSVFVHFPGADRAAAFEKAYAAAKLVTETLFRPPISLEFEKVYEPFLSLACKKYVGVKYLRPDTVDKLDLKGVEVVRRDSCPFVRQVMKRCLDMLMLERQSPAKIAEYLQTCVDQLRNRQVDPAQLLMSKALNKETYQVSMPHAVVAARMQVQPKIGTRVPYFISAGPEKKSSLRAVEPAAILQPNGPVIDHLYYLNKQLREPAIRLLEHVISKERLKEIFDSTSITACKRLAASLSLHELRDRCELNLQQCRSCQGDNFGVVPCRAVDCGVYFRRAFDYKQLCQTLGHEMAELSFL